MGRKQYRGVREGAAIRVDNGVPGIVSIAVVEHRRVGIGKLQLLQSLRRCVGRVLRGFLGGLQEFEDLAFFDQKSILRKAVEEIVRDDNEGFARLRICGKKTRADLLQGIESLKLQDVSLSEFR